MKMMEMKRMPTKIKKSLDEFLAGVSEMFGNRAKKIILYGSYHACIRMEQEKILRKQKIMMQDKGVD